MPHKLTEEGRTIARTANFQQWMKKLESAPNGGRNDVTERHMKILGHDCPDDKSARERLFDFLAERGVTWERFHLNLAPHHSLYLQELYNAGKLSLPMKVAA